MFMWSAGRALVWLSISCWWLVAAAAVAAAPLPTLFFEPRGPSSAIAVCAGAYTIRRVNSRAKLDLSACGGALSAAACLNNEGHRAKDPRKFAAAAAAAVDDRECEAASLLNLGIGLRAAGHRSRAVKALRAAVRALPAEAALYRALGDALSSEETRRRTFRRAVAAGVWHNFWQRPQHLLKGLRAIAIWRREQRPAHARGLEPWERAAQLLERSFAQVTNTQGSCCDFRC